MTWTLAEVAELLSALAPITPGQLEALVAADFLPKPVQGADDVARWSDDAVDELCIRYGEWLALQVAADDAAEITRATIEQARGVRT